MMKQYLSACFVVSWLFNSAVAAIEDSMMSENFFHGVKADSAGASILCVCGKDPRTADRYEARSRALRSISRRRDLSQEDVSALMLAGERGYREALPLAREILDRSQREAVLDTAAIGVVGLLGDLSDILRLESLRTHGGRRLQIPIEKALQRIKGRMSKEAE